MKRFRSTNYEMARPFPIVVFPMVFAALATWATLCSAAQELTDGVADAAKPAMGYLSEVFMKEKRVVFVGDSITYDGNLIVDFESAIRANGKTCPELLNLGLPSETCCGLSEPAHPFPRPNVQDRIDALLEKTNPDVLVICYGINDGIYHPFDQTRFDAYQQGINTLIEKANATGSKVVLMTPPPFDPLPMRIANRLQKLDAKEFSWNQIYENYDGEVIKRYAAWIMNQHKRVAGCIDTHDFLSRQFRRQRATNSQYVLSKDGVHLNQEGHRLLAKPLILAAGLDDSKMVPAAARETIAKRQRLMRDALLSEVGHQRPGMKTGPPIQEATKRAMELNQQLVDQLKSG